MSTSMSSALPENKTAGIALIAGVILTLFASLLYPGGVLIDSVDQTNFPGAIAAMSDNANLTHAMTLLMIFAVLLEAYGLLALFRLVGRQGAYQTRLCDSDLQESSSVEASSFSNWARGTWSST